MTSLPARDIPPPAGVIAGLLVSVLAARFARAAWAAAQREADRQRMANSR